MSLTSTVSDWRGKPGVKISFQVDSDLKSLDTVLGYFEQLEPAGIPKKDWLQCQLALAEGFTNAVRHAHRHLPREIPIEIEIELTPTQLELRIWDRGPAFDLEGFMRKNAARDNRFSGHGQGLPILHKIASKLSYTRTEDQRNCLLIIKQFSDHEPDPAPRFP
jgi:serine/threonine-protein kinase RsbW